MTEALIQALVLDDDPGSRWIGRMACEAFGGIFVHEADSVADAMRVIDEAPIQLALLDVYLPDGKGHEVLQRLKARDADVVCVVASAHPNLSDAVEAMRGQAHDYIQKPYVERESLRQALQRALDTLALRRENRRLMADLEQTIGGLRRVNAELQTTRKSLVERERQASMGRLAMGLMHHINNPLAGMVSNLQYVMKYALPELSGPQAVLEELPECFGEMLESVERVLELVNNLRVVFDSTDAACVDVEGLVRTAIAKVRERATSTVGEHLQIDGSIRVNVDPVRLSTVISNVLVNAAMSREGSAPHVEIRAWRDGDRAVIEIKDDGTGMSPDVKQRATEPFFTTRAASGGLGLGLAAAQGVLVEHGGELAIDSEVGAGTTVTIRLPRVLTTG